MRSTRLSNRLLYVVGPSGSGKDSIMAFARAQLAGQPMVQFAHLARGALDDDVAQRDLAVTADGHLHALGGGASNADDGGAVESGRVLMFHAQ